MAVSYTTTYNLTKPEVGASEDAWGGLLNTNFDNIDNLLDGTTAITGIDINSGSIDGTVIGANSAAAITGTTITGTSFVTSGNMTFGDNDKAIFGAGSDLQIYHDGSSSIITESGAGNLKIQGSNIEFLSATGEDYANFLANGAVRLYYDNAQKLATTSTGVDVTGTVTADGLTVGGDIIQSGGDEIQNSGTLRLSGDYDASGAGDVEFKTKGILRQKIANGGSISFYEDTGTTAKFFWDASAERLGVGTSSPNYSLTSYKAGANANYIQVANGSTGSNSANGTLFGVDASGNGVVTVQGSFDYITSVAGVERMRITSSGSVGIGTSSPSFVSGGGLHVHNSSVARLKVTNSTTGSASTDGYEFQAFEDDLYILGREAAGNMIFSPNNSEAARLNSSGHLLVGTTDAGIYDDATDEAGHNLLSNGQYYNSAVSEINMILNKQNSDGDIVQFRKDGSTVGSIGTGSSLLTIGTGTGNLLFADALVAPAGSSSAGNSNGVVDLGSSGRRFKDLYLSGGAIVGSATSRNLSYASNFSANGADIQLTLERTGTSTGWGGLGANNSSSLVVYNSSTEKVLEVDDSTGSLSSPKSGFGIYLGGTGSANKLDDYEEGTWTPTRVSGSTGGSVLSTGSYCKVGALVTFSLRFATSTATANGDVFVIGGLPFTSSATPTDEGGCTIGYNGNFRSSADITFLNANNGTVLTCYLSNGNGMPGTSATNINGALHLFGFYYTDA